MKTPPERRPLKGTLSWSNGDQMHITVAIDRLAVSNGKLAMLSCVGYVNEIKALRAGLATGCKAAMTFRPGNGSSSLKCKRGEQNCYVEQAYCLGERKYNGESHRLGFNVLHAIFVARTPGLMLDATDLALWHQLKDPRYTTPVLRSWLPYIRQELVALDKLVHLDCLDCDCMSLTATTNDLDTIVQAGLKDGSITITEEEAA